MKYDQNKVDEFALALLYLSTYEDRPYGMRTWKQFDWDIMNRLYEKGYIGNPATKAKSVALSNAGAKLSEELFDKHFGRHS